MFPACKHACHAGVSILQNGLILASLNWLLMCSSGTLASLGLEIPDVVVIVLVNCQEAANKRLFSLLFSWILLC